MMLTYALDVDPSPPRVGAPVTLTIAVTNAGDDAITCTSIALLLPIGTDASDLIEAGATLDGRRPDKWGCSAAAGLVTFTAPPGGVAIKGQGLVFTIATVANGEPGTATVTLSATGSPQPDLPGTSWTVDKFPADFTLSDLTPVPAGRPEVKWRQPATLTWIATGAGVSCTLDYQPADEGAPVSGRVPNIPEGGSYSTQPLTRTGDVVFTLTASVSVLGQDNPMILQRQLSVTVNAMLLTFTAQPSSVGVNGLVRLDWDAPGATSCVLDLGTTLLSSGSLYRVLKESTSFTMVANGPNGEVRSVSCPVKVDPAILANQPGFSASGTQGAQGEDGTSVLLSATPGSAGGPGGDATLTQSLPPLDTKDLSRIIPITVTGGQGGAGGKGGTMSMMQNHQMQPYVVIGGAGGDGGDASAVLTLDDQTQTAAQYIVTIVPGPGGPGGAGGAATQWSIGAKGAPAGNPGSVSLTVDGQAVPLP